MCACVRFRESRALESDRCRGRGRGSREIADSRGPEARRNEKVEESKWKSSEEMTEEVGK